MDRVSDLLSRVLKQRGLHTPVVASFVVLKMNEWIQQHLPQHKDALHVTSFTDGALLIDAQNPIALAEASACQNQLLGALKAIAADTENPRIRLQRSRG